MRRRSRSQLAAVALACTVPIGVLACSSEQELSSWIDQADAICRSAQEAADAEPAPDTPFPGDPLRATAERSRAELDRLRELDPPVQQSEGVGEYLATLNVRIEALENTADALDAAPAGSPPSSESLQEYTNEAYTLAVALGLEECAGGVDFTIDTTTSTALGNDAVASTSPVVTEVTGLPEGVETVEDGIGVEGPPIEPPVTTAP
jgi:hypothetical protein